MDSIWHEFTTRLAGILGGHDFDLSTLAKPSGPLGAVLHMQWHYPTNTKRRFHGFDFRHVLDPSNRSLALQMKKIRAPSNISVSDMISIQQHASNPD